MSFATDTFTLLSGDSGVSAIVGTRISPYVRNTGDRTYLEADSLAEAVVVAIKTATPVARSLTIDRDFGDPYDGSQDLVYRSTVTATLTGWTT